MVDLQLLLFISIIVFFCRCCFSKLNMSEYCRKFTESVNANSPFRYHSLMNHGATCYLNSVLQVLFMTEDFREAVNSSSKSGFIDHHLKDLFKRLLTQTSDAYRIIQALGIEKVNEQQDAAEYLQKILRMTSPEAAQIFHGEMTERSSCLSCQKQVQTNVPFWLLPLSLGEPESENSVDGSIKNFFKISYFRGEDQMYCDNCDRKTDAAGMSVVKHHPDVLILLLKRFVFSYDYMSYVKINCAVEVPFSLNIPENQTYELYAVIDHFGDLRSGHYTSRIRSQQESRWLQFNSSSVSALEGCELSQKGDTESSNAFVRRSKSWARLYPVKPASAALIYEHKHSSPVNSSSAYLLFYRKKDTESTLTVNGGSPPAIRGDPGAEKREHSRDEENRLLHEVSPKTQNPSRNEPFALEEMDISDRYSVEPELNDNVNGLGRTDVESEERDRLQQHSELNVEEEMRNVNDAEHLSLRQNERKDADFDGNNKRKLPEDLNTPEQETCVKRRAQNEENPSVKQENGGQGLEQRGEAEDQRWEEPGLDGFQTGSGFQDGRRSSKQMNVKVLVLEEEEREKAIGSKNIVIKVLEETLYSSVQTYHGHNEHVSQEKYSDEQQ
uniref:Ubiquitin carboxyl-terminal hydrolase 26-like n=1 Tax=Oryzias melastigma TaxID=30732 RepID=A0A3B3DJP6_ORYME